MTLSSFPPFPHFPHSLADIAGFSAGNLAGIFIPIAAILLGGAITISGMYFQNRRRELWHETARLALEKGQPLPPLHPDEDEDKPENTDRTKSRDGNQDVRGGLVLIGVGAGLYLMLGSISPSLRYVGAIPGFIGVALLLYALLAAIFTKKS